LWRRLILPGIYLNCIRVNVKSSGMHGREKIDKKFPPGITPAKNADTERLRQNIYRSDREKLSLFTKMLRRNALYKKARVTHK
jgi:hypothetical protein